MSKNRSKSVQNTAKVFAGLGIIGAAPFCLGAIGDDTVPTYLKVAIFVLLASCLVILGINQDKEKI